MDQEYAAPQIERFQLRSLLGHVGTFAGQIAALGMEMAKYFDRDSEEIALVADAGRAMEQLEEALSEHYPQMESEVVARVLSQPKPFDPEEGSEGDGAVVASINDVAPA